MRILLFIAGLLPSTAYANLDTWGNGGAGIAEMWATIRGTLFTRQDPVQSFSEATINFVFPMIGAVAVLLVMYAGIKMIIGQGDDSAVSEAKEIIYYALGGVLLATIATAIIGYFGTVFFPVLFQ